jgi:hypothetical protein
MTQQLETTRRPRGPNEAILRHSTLRVDEDGELEGRRAVVRGGIMITLTGRTTENEGRNDGDEVEGASGAGTSSCSVSTATMSGNSGVNRRRSCHAETKLYAERRDRSFPC